MDEPTALGTRPTPVSRPSTKPEIYEGGNVAYHER